MKILDALRRRQTTADPSREEAGPADADGLAIPGYDKLDHPKVAARLHLLSQTELAAVEDYERAHKNRTEVLAKLRYMRTTEPLPGYDALTPEQINGSLADADAETVKAVRDYERKFKHRQGVMEQAARVLPTAKPSAAEASAQEAREARIQDGFASRTKTVDSLAD